MASSAAAITEFPIPTANSEPNGITTGPDGNLWFTEPEYDSRVAKASRIGRITPSGTISEFPVAGVSTEIKTGPDGNLWFGQAGKVGRITPSGTISGEFLTPPLPLFEYSPSGPVVVGSSYPRPVAITTGPDGNLWFTGQSPQGNQIGRITPSGTITDFPLPKSPGAYLGPQGIAAGPDGNLWFTDTDANQIGRITPSGMITEFPIPTARSEAGGIAAGPDGNLWFTEAEAGRIGRITPSGTIREFPIPTRLSRAYLGPVRITAGPDGNLWFTEYQGSRIGRITPSGTISEFPIPTADGKPQGITTGPDGNLWFTEGKGSKIGRINLRLLTPAKYKVPKLMGKTLSQAKRLLARSHFKLGKVSSPKRQGKHRPVVVSQKPGAGKALPAGSKIAVRLG